MEAVEKFRNLLTMAAADQRMCEDELRMLSHRATELGVTDDEFEGALDMAISGKSELTIPKNHRDMREFLEDMIRMMAADGMISEPERKLFAAVSAAIGISSDELNRLIDDVVRES